MERAPGGSDEEGVVDLENPTPTLGADLPCPIAIEFLADIHEEDGGDAIPKACEVEFSCPVDLASC